jgi:hypothetical protein
MVQNGCGNGLGVAVAMTAIATRFAVILAESGLAPMSKKVAQKEKYFAHVYTVTRTTWDLDIFSNYDYDAHVGVKPCDGEIALEVHRILQDRLVKEGQRPPYSSAGLHTDTSRVSLLYAKPRTAATCSEGSAVICNVSPQSICAEMSKASFDWEATKLSRNL